MKRFKILVILLITYFLTGCTVSYNLNINEDSIKEETIINMNSDEYTEFSSNKDNEYINMYVDDENNTAEEGASLPLPNVTYYTFKKNNNAYTATYTGNFNLNNYKRSSIRSMGFQTVKLYKKDNKLIIKSSTEFTFPYDNISEVVINITSPYTVSYSNADSVNGNTLTWRINETNAKYKFISAEYNTNKDDTTDNSTNNDVDNNSSNIDKTDDNKKIDYKLVLMISGLVILVGFMVFLVLLFKYKKTNSV